MGKILIVGGVAGGASAAARLRRLDETAEIILFERGNYVSFANCGLPYYTGGVIEKRGALLLQTPERLRKRFNIDVRIGQEVIAIDRCNKTVTVFDHGERRDYSEAYDTLILATGSSPVVPDIEGIDLPMVRRIWTVDDADAIKTMLDEKGVKTATIVGGGFIGVEMAENLRARGVDVTIVELSGQALNQFDPEMAEIVHDAIRTAGVKLLLHTAVESFAPLPEDRICMRTSAGATIESDLVVLAIGTRPNGALAAEAGLKVNSRGGVATDEWMRTADEAIYAVGDVAEVARIVDRERIMLPLAGPANKQGRVVANALGGRSEMYAGVTGTSIVQAFSQNAAATGLNEKTLIASGQRRGTDYEVAYIAQKSHAGYYPNAKPMMIKLVFEKAGGRVLGAQIVGTDGVDKRIDVISATIRFCGTIQDLAALDLAYAPPFSSAKDPINMAGYVAGNVLDGLLRFSEWDVDLRDADTVYVDVREDKERAAFSLQGTVNIPMDLLRTRYGQIDPQKRVVIFCAVGVRAYNAARFLMQNGYKNVLVYPGGMYFYRKTHV